MFPGQRAIEVFLSGYRFFVTWGVILILCALWTLGRQYLRSQYPQSPPVPKGTYAILVPMLLVWLVMIYIDEHYRVGSVPDSPVLQLYLALFGHRRHIVTWPLTYFLLYRLLSYLFRNRGP